MGRNARLVAAFKVPVDELNKEMKRYRPKSYLGKKLQLSEAQGIYKKWGGRCAFCGNNLSVRDNTGKHALKFTFYNPLKYNGTLSRDNIVTCCIEHKKSHNSLINLREHIPDVNTLGDLFYFLIKIAIEHRETPLPETEEKLRRIKRLINMELSDIVASMRYAPMKDWTPDYLEIFYEDRTSYPERVQALLNAVIDKDVDRIEGSLQKIDNANKQIVSTKQYKIVRKPEQHTLQRNRSKRK